jgi:hypothetical protein
VSGPDTESQLVADSLLDAMRMRDLKRVRNVGQIAEELTKIEIERERRRTKEPRR